MNDQQQTYYTLMSSSKVDKLDLKLELNSKQGKLAAGGEDGMDDLVEQQQDGLEEGEEEDDEDVEGEGEGDDEDEDDEVGDDDDDDDQDDEEDDGVGIENNVLDEDNEIDEDRIGNNARVSRIRHSGISRNENSDDLAGLLGFNNHDNNNLENEENNRSALFCSPDGDIETSGTNQGGGNQHRQSSGSKHIKKTINKQRQQKQQQQSNGGGTTKKRRRRRQRQLNTGGESTSGGANNRSRNNAILPNKKLANRNGESILNGMGVSSQAPSSILTLHTNVASVASNQTLAAQTQLQHQQQVSISQQNHINKSVPSSASTASNSSTSSSMSLNLNSQHHQSRQNSSSAVAATNHHAHHQHQTHNPHHGQQSGGGSVTGGGHKPTRVRTVLNEKQLQTLRDCYACNPRPDALMKEQLVDMTGLSSRVIRVWFQVSPMFSRSRVALFIIMSVALIVLCQFVYDSCCCCCCCCRASTLNLLNG